MRNEQTQDALFQMSLARTLKHEGGYANHPADRGGETWRGVSRVHHPDWPGWAVIDAQDNPDALMDHADLNAYVCSLYKAQYWEKTAAGQAPTVETASRIFDFAVNAGPARSVRFVQIALSALGDDLQADGIAGPLTRQALSEFKDGPLLLTCLEAMQRRYYINRAYRAPDQRVFLKGWLNRLSK